MPLASVKAIEAKARELFASANATSHLNPKLPEGYLVANNSFLHREGATFSKSDTYLAVPVGKGGQILPRSLVLVNGISKNADFDFIATGSFAGRAIRLSDGVTELLRRFGRLVFIMLGRIEQGGPFEQPINSAVFTRLVYDRHFRESFRISGTEIRINRLFDEDRLWSLVQNSPGWEPEKNFGAQLAAALGILKAEAHDSLHLPVSSTQVPNNSLLDQMTTAFQRAATDYGLAVRSWKQNRSDAALNEVMRLAYNFSSDAMLLAEFVMALSDLKPLIFLLTIDDQYKFATTLRSLLKRRARRKPSLRGYSEVISDARSAAFHRLVPFDAAIEVDQIELSGVRLRLFPEFQERRNNVLDFEDRPLLELLAQMARPTLRELEESFWDENEAVMKATVDLLKALRLALVTVLSDIETLQPTRG